MAGVLLYFVETDLSQSELQKIYSDEFVIDRLSVPGTINAQRYRAIDGKTPSRLSLYNISSAGKDTAISNLSPTDAQKDSFGRFKTLNRRSYELIYEKSAPQATSCTSSDFSPAKYIMAVSVDITNPSIESEINDWYNNEHIPDISKAKGWISSRRYKLLRSDELSSSKDAVTPHAHRYIAFHAFDHPDITTDPAIIASVNTERAMKFMPEMDLEIRSFELFKQFK